MFVDDIPLENPYFAVILRSPAAKGKIKSIGFPHLDDEDDNFTLIRAGDIPGTNFLFDKRLRLLAEDSVSYIGEPVALICGPEPRKLEEYAARFAIEIEEEKPEFSIEDAWDAGDFFAQKQQKAGSLPKAKGEIVVEGHYETGIQEHWYSEPHGAIARIENGRVIIDCAAQMPDELCATVAAVLDIEREKVELRQSELGIHFDGKIWYPAVIAALAALAAWTSGKTVKLQLTRQEDYLYSPKRTQSVVHIRSLLTFDGQILETDVLAKIGFGAAGVYAERILDEVARSFLGVYKTGSITVEALAIKTNVPPCGPFAGFGASLAAFAMEMHIAKILDTLNESKEWQDSGEWREGSAWRKAHLRQKVKELEIIKLAARESDFKRKWAVYDLLRGKISNTLESAERILPQRGIGIAFGAGGASENNALFEHNTVFPVATCVVEIEIDRVNYESVLRGIWLHIACGRPENTAKAELTLRRAVLAAIGWTSTEKIKFINGKISPPLCALYETIGTSAAPQININFAYEEGAAPCELSRLIALPFCVVPAAFAQAISQAIDYHLRRIPIIGIDVWRVIKMKQEERSKSHAEPGAESDDA